jgi:capsular exopolysaccharide synthesis family protein
MALSVDDAFVESHRQSSEALRKLRTNLRFMNVDEPPKVIVVTSPKPGDGKSTISANLAAAIAISGQRTVLVDADLRRPTLGTSFGLVDSAGLTDVLTGVVHVQDVLQRVAEHPNLALLSSGSLPPNPSELLGSNAMRNVLREMSEVATVIIDAPPLLPVTDAAILTAVADGAFIVVSAGSTLDTDLAACLDQLEAVNGRALGVIFNRVKRGAPDAGYYASDYYTTQPAAHSVGRRRAASQSR